MTERSFRDYTNTLRRLLSSVAVTREGGAPAELEAGLETLLAIVKLCRLKGATLMWMGNGGSAAIASHEANDFMRNGNCRSMAFHEASMLTCLSNDIGFGAYFEEMTRRFARKGDLAAFISSSGKSENVVRGARMARGMGCTVVTMTGFRPGNELRQLGHLNFYVDSMEYGYVELCHQILCHYVLDVLLATDTETKP